MLEELADELGLRGHGRAGEARRHLPIARPDVDWMERPKKRSDCADGPRPCPWAGCEFNLLIEVDPRTGHLHMPFGTTDVDELPESCWLDVADRMGATLDQVGRALNVSRERVRQIEERTLQVIADHTGAELGITADRGEGFVARIPKGRGG